MFDECLDTHPAQTGATRSKVRRSEREQCMFDDEWEIASSYGLQIFFLRLTCTNTIVMWKFGKFQGSFDLLKTFKWFSNHLMTVIQIWLHLHATPNQNGLIIIFSCTCVRVNSICSKLEGIFKRIGLKEWAHMHGVPCHFNYKKIIND